MVLICGLTLISASCKKEKKGIDGLPPATQTGANTFGCLVNGVLFIPKGNSSGTTFKQVNYGYEGGILSFYLSGSDMSRSGKLLSVKLRSSNISLQTGVIIP
jgi:hypothetical protein